MLSVFSKIFEKLMDKHLYIYQEHHKILYQFQFGFKEKHSTCHALISIAEKIKNALENSEFGCGIFINLKKAFDTVNHSILSSKLYHYGICGITNDWFKYLSNRQQYVSLNAWSSFYQPPCNMWCSTGFGFRPLVILALYK